jgi:hypothetical protein
MKAKETLEEAAEKYATNHGMMLYVFPEKREAFISGAKWQAERMYSEDDLREAFRQGRDGVNYNEVYGYTSEFTEHEWFEQFKKK